MLSLHNNAILYKQRYPIRVPLCIVLTIEKRKEGRISTTFDYCRDTRIRTWDPLLPKQVR